jgi:hypothetical protein
LASKAEEAWVKIDELSHCTKVPPELIAEHELFVLDGIGFHLRVHHPYRPLRGLIQLLRDMKLFGDGKESLKLLGNVKNEATKVIDSCRTSNLAMLYTPPQIALACLVHCLRELSQADIVPNDAEERLLFSDKLIQESNGKLDELRRVIDRIVNIIIEEENSAELDKETVGKIWQKWSNFHNPCNDPASETY